MDRFHVVCGLPRAGSTLLCNILNQNPTFHASSTSVLAQTVGGLSHLWSSSPEIKSDLAHDREGTERRLNRTLKALCEAWYPADGTVFDKGRGWAFHALTIKAVYPDAQIIVMVRDLRAVFGSVEKQHQRYPILDDASEPLGKTIYARADQMLSPQGLIGGPVNGVMDLIRRQPEGLIVIQYETFVRNPQMIMDRLYAELEEEPFEHDFEDVTNTATDMDALYLNKYPHDGSGKVQPGDGWEKYISSDLAQQIMGRYPGYNQAFGYA